MRRATLHNPENPVHEVAGRKHRLLITSDFSYKKDSARAGACRISHLDIRSGETIGIIGATGSAKSSLVSLISRLYDVTAGEVLVGGRNVKEYDMDSLRNQVSVVLTEQCAVLRHHLRQSALGRSECH